MKMNTLTPPYASFFLTKRNFRSTTRYYYDLLPTLHTPRECIMQCRVLFFIHYTHAECMYIMRIVQVEVGGVLIQRVTCTCMCTCIYVRTHIILFIYVASWMSRKLFRGRGRARYSFRHRHRDLALVQFWVINKVRGKCVSYSSEVKCATYLFVNERIDLLQWPAVHVLWKWLELAGQQRTVLHGGLSAWVKSIFAHQLNMTVLVFDL